MKNIVIKSITLAGAVMFIAFLPYFAAVTNASEVLGKAEIIVKNDNVTSMLFIAAQNGDAKAQTLYIKQNTQPKTQASKSIIDLAKKWAEDGNVSLMVWFGDNHYTGNQLPQGLKNAGYWYTKAAKIGDTTAQFNLGYMYFHGQGAKKNLHFAQELLTLSANKNHASSINLLKKVNAEIASLNAEWKQIKEEQRLAQIAVDKSREKVRKAQLAVEKANKKVKSIKKKTLAELVKKEIGLCYSGKANSCFDLAVANETGKITGKPEYEISEKLYIKACEMESYRACMNLANNYASKKFKSLSKDGIDTGFKKSFNLYKKSCTGDIEPACSYYASLNIRFANGQKEAAWAYDKSCNLGSAESCLKVGEIYYAGKGGIDRQDGGITKDLVRAKTYFITACKGGIQRACKLKIEISKQDVKLKRAALEASQKKTTLLKEKLALAEAHLREAKLRNYFLAENSKFSEGTAFKLIKNAPLRTDKVMITQYFSYDCEGCNLLQINGNLDRWVNNQNKDVRFNKIHITGRNKFLARLFYTLEKMNSEKSIHRDIFNQISSKQPIYTKDNGFLDFVSRHGIDTKLFKGIYSSTEMDQKIEAHANHEKTLSFKRIPAFVVNGQYYVTPVTAGASKPHISSNLSEGELNRQLDFRMFEIMDYLVNVERGVIKNK